MISVNTNRGAMVALQNLAQTQKELDVTQNRVSTGKKVSSAKDNGAVWAVANKMSSDVSAYDAVASSNERAQALVDTAVAAGESVSELLTKMKEVALAATQTGLSASAQSSYAASFAEYRDQVTSIIGNASFDGQNMVGATPDGAVAIGDAAGGNSITVAGADLSLGGSIVTVTATSALDTAANATTALGLVNASIDNLSEQLATWGAGSERLQSHASFVSKLQDALNSGIGAMTDADLSKESAKLTALQTKQQLGAQALSIANSSSQIALSLFQ
jgi:flagellin